MEEHPPWSSISFACGGWLQFYLYGVARAIQAHGLDSPNVTYLGCSAGALAAVGIVLNGDFDIAMQFCKEECVPKAHGEVLGLFQLTEYVAQCLELTLLPKYKNIPVGQLQIAVTNLPFLTRERVVQFNSKDDLKKALLASCAAFPLASLVYRRGKWCMDGGITDFQPIIDSETITVSPFYFSDADIKPSRYVPLWWAFLPPKSKETVDWLYSLGFHDAIKFFESKGIPESSTSRPHIKSLLKKPHPYDIPKRVSIHRFLGYDLGNLTHEYVSFTMDFILLVLLVVVWRPLVLLLIYIELLSHITIQLIISIFIEIIFILPLLLISLIIIEDIKMTIGICLITYIQKLIIFGPSEKKRLKFSLDCFNCIWSLSLLLRFFTPACPKYLLNKHSVLVKTSFLYRFFNHMI